MPKFYGQNKKRIDPRYFLDETIDQDERGDAIARAELTDTDRRADGTTVAGDWPDSERPPWADPDASSDPMERAGALAQQGMEQASGMDPGLLDGMMEDGTPVVDVLNLVRKQLNIPGGTAVLQKFDQMLKELGVELGTPPDSSSYEGPDVDADEMEDSLERFRQNAKQPPPIGE